MNHQTHSSNHKTLHGNHAKIDPSKAIESLNQSCLVTASDHVEHGSPIVDEENVRYAKKFVEENKK